MSSSDYHMVWVHNIVSGDDFDLYLYTDSGYSSFVESSISSSLDIDWIVYRSSSSRYMYPKVYAYDSGQGVIEAESGFDGSVGNSYTVCSGTYEYGDIYEFSLSSTNRYTVSLTVPYDTDLDLYAYYFPTGGSADYNDEDYSSESSTLGADEEITLISPTSGYWAFAIIRKEGTGSGTLSITRITMMIPSFEFIPVLSALILAIYVSILFLKRKPNLFKNI